MRGITVKIIASFAELQASAVAGKQRLIDQFFQALYLQADCGLRSAEYLTGLGKTAELGHRYKGSEKFHGKVFHGGHKYL